MRPSQQAEVFVRKADEDIHVLRRLVDDPGTTDAIWGFHAQQAVEKLLKAIMVHWELQVPFTHRLLDLADLLTDAGRGLPEEYETLLDLTPYAVEFRYSVLPEDRYDRLDRPSIVATVQALRQFVFDLLRMTD